MTRTREVTIISTRHDDVTGGTATIEWLAHRPVRKDGSDSKRPVRRTGAYTIRFADGSFRQYGPAGPAGAIGLIGEHVTRERLAMERA